MKARTHTLRELDTPVGERDFFATLREHPTVPAVKRVEKVLTLLVEADKLAREQREQMRLLERSGKDWHRSKSFMESLHAYERTCQSLNVELRRYPWTAVAHPRVGKFCIVDHHVTTSAGRWAPWECGAIGQLLDLARKPGGLSRLRRCSECLQWFYAIKGHQQFCKVSCRRHHTAQDPVFKENRAAYMREQYRPLQKELAENTWARVRIGQRGKSK